MSVEKQWEDLLTPAVMQDRLISASLYLTSYEMLKESIIRRIRDVYCIGFDADGPTISQDYQEEVLSLHKSPLYASLKWLQDAEVINQADVQTFEELKRLRNLLAHELSLIVFTGKEVALMDRMRELMDLLRKIEIWWVINVEIATDPDFDGREINPDKVTPGPVLMMQMIFEVLSGNKSLLEHYKQAVGSNRPA
jgi:hypothetical protein